MMAMMDKLLQQREIAIYIVSAATAATMFIWRRLPGDASINWRIAKRVFIAWLIAAEWILIAMGQR
jgi:hypothetical protein